MTEQPGFSTEQPDDGGAPQRAGAAGSGPGDHSLGFTVCLYRYTRNVEQMVKFLSVLGLHRSGVRDADGCTYLWGRAGMVALFDASSGEGPSELGETQLTFDTNDAAAAAVQLRAAGSRVVEIDEPDTPALGVADPQGHGIRVKESFRDAADTEDDEAVEPVDVVAVRYSGDFDADAAFFANFGFTAKDASPHWQPLVGPGDAGVVGLHPPGAEHHQAATPSSPVGSPALAGLAFQVGGGLGDLAARLAAAGHRTEDVSAKLHHPALVVVDPDGVRLEVHEFG